MLAESTGTLLSPAGRIAYQNGGSTVHVGSKRSLLIKLQFPEASQWEHSIFLQMLLRRCGTWNWSLSSLWKIHGKSLRTLEDTGMGTLDTIMESAVNILVSSLLTPRRFREVFFLARTFVNADLFLADTFYPMVRRGTWRHNNGDWYENDVVWTNSKARRSVTKIRNKHASFSDHVVKRYSIDFGFGQGNSAEIKRRTPLSSEQHKKW